MGLLFKLKCFFIRTFKSQKYQEFFITKSIFSNNHTLDALQFFENFFNSLFNTSFYNYLFEASIYKKDFNTLEYLINKINLDIPQEKALLNQIFQHLTTSDLKSKNYFSWLAIISSHTNFQLMGLEKNYNYEDHYSFVSYFLTHDKVKKYFNNIQTQELILENCHDNAQKMFAALFLDIKLSSKKALPKVMPSKVKKI